MGFGIANNKAHWLNAYLTLRFFFASQFFFFGKWQHRQKWFISVYLNEVIHFLLHVNSNNEICLWFNSFVLDEGGAYFFYGNVHLCFGKILSSTWNSLIQTCTERQTKVIIMFSQLYNTKMKKKQLWFQMTKENDEHTEYIHDLEPLIFCALDALSYYFVFSFLFTLVLFIYLSIEFSLLAAVFFSL